MPIFIYYFDCILQGSKFINVIAFRMVNAYLCLLLGKQFAYKLKRRCILWHLYNY